MTETEFKPIHQKATQAKKLINGFIRYLRESQAKPRPPDHGPPDHSTNDHPTT